jgi:RNA polymerase sigma-70 factor (ECF subfamily)
MDPDSEDALVDRLRDGDAAAFDALYEAYRPRLFGFLLRLTRQRSLAEDLLDETWLRLVAHARTLRADTRIGAWLFTVARNLYWSYRRSSMTEAGALSLWPAERQDPTPFEIAATNELHGRIERALAKLTAQQREVLLLVAVEGLAPSEAAGICGITAEAMRQRLSRARAALAAEMNDDSNPEETGERSTSRTVARLADRRQSRAG